jgi:hypothetical protein
VVPACDPVSAPVPPPVEAPVLEPPLPVLDPPVLDPPVLDPPVLPPPAFASPPMLEPRPALALLEPAPPLVPAPLLVPTPVPALPPLADALVPELDPPLDPPVLGPPALEPPALAPRLPPEPDRWRTRGPLEITTPSSGVSSPTGTGSPTSTGAVSGGAGKASSSSLVVIGGGVAAERIATHAPPAPTTRNSTAPPMRIAHVLAGDCTPMPASVNEVVLFIAFGAPPRLAVEEPLGPALGGRGPPGSPACAMRAPHMLQNFASSVFWAPHAWQKIIRSSGLAVGRIL